MADKKKKINSAISAAGRAASKTSSNVADQLKKKKKSAQQAAQMQESQKKLPSWYGSIDTSKPRVQQRSTTSTSKGRSVFAPQQQTTTQPTSRTGSMWPIVPKKTSAGLPSLAQVYGAPYRSDFAAYLPSSAMRGTVDPAKVTGAHYAEWMSDMADQKAADEARARQKVRQQQKKQALQDKREQYSGIGWEDNSDGSPGIKSIIHGYQNDLRDERDPKKRSEIQGQIDWLSSYAASQYPEAGQYFAEEDARQEAFLKRRQEDIQRRQTEAERNLENARHGIYTDDVLREYGKYDETLAGFDRDIAAATDPDVIGYLTRAREAYMANPANYQDLELSDEQQAEVMARYIRQSDYAKLASEQAAEDSPDYYKKLDRQYGFSATEEAFAKGLASPAETDFNGYVKQRQGGLSVSDMVSPFYRTQDYYRQYYTLDEYAIWQQYLRGGNQEAADAYEDYIRDRVGRRASQDWQEGVEKMTSGRLTPETFRGYKERTYTVPNLGGEGTVSYTRRYSVQPTAAQKVIGGAVGTVAEVGANFMSGLHSLDVLGQSLERAVTGSDKPIDYYRSSATTETAQTTWGTVASELNQYGDLNDFVSRIYGQRVNIPVVGDKGLGELYGAGVNGLNNWMNRMAFGGSKWLGVAADLQAASGKFNSAHETGASDLQSVFYGSAVGAAEGLGEQMGYDKFLEWGEEKGLFNSTSGKILLGLVLQPGNEFVEESVTEIMDQAASLGILDDKSEYAGMPYSERLEQVIYAGIQGAIGSYVSTGGQYAEMSVENNAQRRATQELTGQLVLANDNGAQLAQAYTDATGKPGDTPTKVRQAGRMLEEAATLGKERYESTYAQETGDAAVQYYQDNQPKGQEADKKASETVYAAIRKVLADKKLTRREQAAMDSIPGVREAVAAYRKGGAMEGTVNREGSAKIKRGMENALLSVDHNLQSAGLDSNVETDIKTSERMQQTAQGVQEAAQERKAMMQMREGENAQSQVDGQDVELLGMTGVGDKATLNVRNQDGQVQEVSLNDVTYGSDRKATAYAIGADMENTALANSFVATLADNQVPARVAAGMQAAYDYAYGGAPSVESLKGSILTEGLNDAQLSRAFELGQQARQAAVQVAQETKMKQALKQANVEWKGGTVDTSKVDMASLNAEQQRQVNLVQLVAGVTGINVELFQSKADANGRYRGENGSYNATTNTIRLDVNAGAYNAGELSQVTLLRTMSHELTHALQQNSLAQYEALKHAVLDVLTSKSGASIEEMAARKMEQDSSLKKPDVALDEVVAEACENMLRDSDAMEQLIAQHPAEAKTFLEKVKKFFTDIVNAIRAAFGGSDTSRSREATALMQQAEEYLDICEKWSKALQETAEISGRMERQTGDGDVQYSLRDETYLAAVEDGDMQKAQAMVDEAARQAGYTRKLYHGTQYQFNQFMRGGEGIHLGTFEAADFVRRTTVKGENQGRMIEAYVRLDNPMYVPYDIQRWNVENLRDLIFAANGLQTSKELLATTADGRQIDLDFSQVEGIPQITKKAPRPARSVQVDEDFGTSRRKTRRGAAVQTEQVTTRETNRALSDEEQLSRMKTFDEIAEWLKARGIDGIEYTNAIEDKNSTSVLVFDSNQVKLADAVTYDDQGDVIPLSERFDKGNEDIRYSLRETDDGKPYTLIDASEIQGENIKDSDTIGRKARVYMKERYKGVVLPVGKTKSAYVRRDGINEYTNPAKYVDAGTYSSKMLAATELDNLLKGSEYLRWRADDGHHKDAVRGWTYWKTVFAVRDSKTNEVNVYEGEVQIKRIERGDLFHDITHIKNITNDNIGQSIIMDAKSVGDNASIAPSDGSVKYSLRENVEQTDDIRYQLRDEDGDAQGLVGIFDETPRLGEAHIDQRTWENMSDRRVHSFMNDYPASRMWLARMASILQSDVTASTAGQRFMNEEGTFMGQKRDTTPLLAEMKDSGYTWQQMADVFGKMAEVFENGDLEGKVPETALWKRAELILDRAVTEGYTDMNGIEYRPDAGYMRYKDELPGAKAREIPANAVEDTFEDVDNRLAGGENAAVQTGGDGERMQLQGDTAYQEKQRSAKSGIALMDGGPSNRELLSSALESAAQTPEELRYVQNYKKQAQRIAEMEGLLAERRAEVQQLQGMKKRTADQEIRMKNLQTSIAETESMIDKRDKGLLKMEAMEPLRNVLDRERAKYREKLKQAKKDAAARQQEKDAAKLGETKEQLTAANRQLKKAQMQRLAAQRAEKRKLAAQKLRLQKQADRRVAKIQDKANRRTLQGKIIRRVKALDTMLRTPSNTRHVPDALRGATANILQYFTDESKIFKAEDMQAAANAYAALNTEENSNMAEGMYDPDTYDRMVALMEATKKGQSLKKLSVDELTMVDKVLQNLSHIIQNANAVFVNGRRRNLEDMVNEEVALLKEKGRYGSFKLKDNILVDMLRYENVTAPYFFKHIGGPIADLGNAILDAESTYGLESRTVTEKIEEIAKKYDYIHWKDSKDTLTLTHEDGEEITLTREQALSVYATWRRENSIPGRETHHLDQGGITLRQKVKLFKKTYAQDGSFTIGQKEISRINDWLTERQKAYADDMVALSGYTGDLANITSNAMHGYSKFEEPYYFRFSTDASYRATNLSSKDTGDKTLMIKNTGSARSVKNKANAPLVIGDFTDTVCDQLNDTLIYYAFAEVQDNFMRLYNYRMDRNHSIKQMLDTTYGKKTSKYLLGFMRNLYGGVATGSNTIFEKGTKIFKRNAIAASLSVAFRQPSAVLRAMAVIDPKYFVPAKGGFAEAMQYAGTAVIKDMGSFDTSTGRSAVQYFKYDKSTNKLKTVKNATMDFLTGWAPEQADKIAWGLLWSAAKRETAAKTGLSINSEECKKLAGKRFDQVVRLTQVYDSTLTKSPLMRDKDGLVKMATAFMAESTVTYNMLMDSIIDASGKRFKSAGRSVGAVIAATLLDSLLASIIYAMRDDDDEDATYFERYVKSVVGMLNPTEFVAGMLPFAKDVYEIFHGYDVKRTDMTVVSDAYTFLKAVTNPDKSWYDRLKSGVSFTGLLIGAPAKNIWREVDALLNTISAFSKNEPREGALKMAVMQGLGEWDFGPDVSKAATIDKLVRAMANGDQAEAAAQMNTLSTFYEGDEKKRKTAIKKAGKEAYIDGNLTDAQALRVLEGIGITGDEADKVLLDWQYGKKTGGKTVGGAGSDYLEGEIDRETALDALSRTGSEEEDVETRMRKLDYQKESGISYSGLQDAYTDGRISRAEALRVRTEVGGQKPEEAEKTLLQWDYEKDTGRKWADMQKDFAAGTISESKATEYLMQYGSQKRKDAEATVGHWKYEVDTGRKWDEMQDDFEAGTITSKQAVKYLVDYGHRKTEDAKNAVSHWQYEKDTGRKWADMGYDYLSGSLTKAQAMSAMQKYGGKTEAEAYWTVDEWEYKEANPDADGYSKFHRVTDLASRGQNISSAVQEIYSHSDYKTAKDCGSAVTSALTSYWKPLYIAATPAQREQMEPIMLAAYRAAYETLGEKYYGDKRRLKAIRKWLED